MVKKRIIPVLLLKNGRMVKGKKFTDFIDTGNPITCAKVYNAQDCDELVILDIDATRDGKKTFFHAIEEIAQECFMPLSIGGGIKSIQDIKDLLNAGADKVVITSEATKNINFIQEASQIFGSQCIICGIDLKRKNGSLVVCANSNTIETTLDFSEYLQELEKNGAGEIFLNSIDNDGTMSGYDLDILDTARKICNIPLIMCGGAGNYMDLYKAFEHEANAVACASLFHFGDNNPLRVKAALKNLNINLKNV